MAMFFDNAVRDSILRRVPLWIHPNHLTIIRAVLLIPLVLTTSMLTLVGMLSAIPPVSVAIVIFSSLCDLFDGPLARFRRIESNDGGALDALCDKLFVIGAFWSVCLPLVAFWQIVVMTVIDAFLTIIRPFKPDKPGSTFAKAPGAVKVWLQSIGIIMILTGSAWLREAAFYAFGVAIIAGALSLVSHLRDFRGATERV